MLARESILPIEAPRSRRIRVRFLCLALGACVFFLSCGQSTESRLAESRSLQAAGQFAASIAPLRKALSEDADHPEANYLLGIALARTGQKSLAVWPLRKASESDDYGVLAGLILGSTLHVDQSLAEAVRAYSNVLQIDPENQVALVARGTAQINRGLPELALADADRLLELSPNLQSAILLRAAALLDLGRRDEAEELLVGLAEQATELDSPEAGRTCAGLALFYSDRRDSTRATETFERCLEQYPGDPMLQRMASEFFVNQSNPEKAIAVWRGAVDARPENLQPRVKLAQNLVEHGRGGEAEAVLREAVELFDSSQAWRELADFYREQKSPEKAREALEEAMQRSREVSSAARFALADLLIKEGNFERARQIAESLEEPAYKHLLTGSILLKLDRPAQALEEFDAGLLEWPNNPGGRYLAGLAAFALGDHTRALAEYREAIRSGEDQTDAALRAAEIYYRMGNFSLAHHFATRQIQHRPDPEGRAHLIAARSALAAGKTTEVEAILTRLKARLPEGTTAYVEYASFMRVQNGPAAALEVILDSDLDLTDLTHIDAVHSALMDRLALNQISEASGMLDAVLAAHPDSAEAQNLQAQFFHLTGQPEQALVAFDSVLAVEPEHLSTLLAKGNLLRDQGDLVGAKRLFEQAQVADPNSGEYVYRLGQIALMQGDEAVAETRFREALRLDPFLVGPNNDLAWLLASHGRELEMALTLANRAVRRNPNADTLDTLGYVQLKSGDTEKAASTLAKALQERPDSASIRYRLGAALAAQGETDQARQVLTEALETPSFPEAESAREELARLQGS